MLFLYLVTSVEDVCVNTAVFQLASNLIPLHSFIKFLRRIEFFYTCYKTSPLISAYTPILKCQPDQKKLPKIMLNLQKFPTYRKLVVLPHYVTFQRGYLYSEENGYSLIVLYKLNTSTLDLSTLSVVGSIQFSSGHTKNLYLC